MTGGEACVPKVESYQQRRQALRVHTAPLSQGERRGEEPMGRTEGPRLKPAQPLPHGPDCHS